MVPGKVEFFYDFSCPYAYLAHTQIEALCTAEGAELVWKPFLLGGVFKAVGFTGASMGPAKAKNNLRDMHRWADHFGVPLRMPPTHPNRTVLALRAALAAGDALAAASKAIYRAYWVDARDVSDGGVLRAALDGAGLDGAALIAGADTDAIKADLRARTDEAIAADVFGAPTFLVSGTDGGPAQLFWGQDRLEFVRKALQGWRPLLPDAPRAAS
jgi:2-hydroxychromene-2-carboxylate isomerase